jgi:rfaE bifunctional protein nucleotidyltransferase chain/domain
MSSRPGRPPTEWVEIDALHGSEKVLPLEDLEPVVARAKAQGKRVVFTNGCFDLLHVGHVHCLEGAKACGDLLIVGINSDASTRRLKGSHRPIVPQQERAALLAALSAVDYVVVFDEPQPLVPLNRLKPDVHAKGTDYTEQTVPERDAVLAYGGEVAITGDAKRPGTRGMVDTILERYGKRSDA